MENIFQEIKQEREKQDSKWGVQSWDSVDSILLERRDSNRLCEHYEIPNETRAKFLCDNSFKYKRRTWAHIITEELSESVSCLDDISRRKELIQLAACVVAWIQDIDTKIKNK